MSNIIAVTYVPATLLFWVVAFFVFVIALFIVAMRWHRKTIRAMDTRGLQLIDECKKLKANLDHARKALGKAHTNLDACRAGFDYLAEEGMTVRINARNPKEGFMVCKLEQLDYRTPHGFAHDVIPVCTGKTGEDAVANAMMAQMTREAAEREQRTQALAGQFQEAVNRKLDESNA